MADYQEGDTAGNGAYTFMGGGWHPTEMLPPKTAGTTPTSIDSGTPGKIPQLKSEAPPMTVKELKETLPTKLEEGFAGLITAPPSMLDLAERGVTYGARKAGEAIGIPQEKIDESLKTFGKPALNAALGVNPLGIALQHAPTYEEFQKGVQRSYGPLPQPESTGAKYLGSVAQFAPAAMAGPGGMMAKALRGTAGALGSEAAGQFMEGSPYEGISRMAGALAGSQGPAMARHALTPNPAAPELTGQANMLRGAGINPLASQATGRTGSLLGKVEGMVAPDDLAATQQRGLTKGMIKTMGVDSDTVLDSFGKETVIPQGQRKLWNDHAALLKRNSLPFDAGNPQDPLMAPITKAHTDYLKSVNPNDVDPQVEGYLNAIRYGETGKPMAKADLAGMTGDRYQMLRSDISAAAQDAEPKAASALKDMRDALDRAMGNAVRPEDKEAFSKFTDQWTNSRTLKSASEKITGKTAGGQLDPAKVYAKADDKSGELPQLARAGMSVLKPPASGGIGMGDFPALLGGAAGAYLGHKTGVPGEGFTGGIFGQMAFPHMVNSLLKTPGVGSALLSAPMQKYLSNQWFLPGPATQGDTQQLLRVLAADPALKPQQ